MEIGDTVRVVDYSDNSLANEYIGRTGVITEDLLPDEGMYGDLKYKVTFESDSELFKKDELETVTPQGFESLEVDLPEDTLEMLGVWSEETGLSEETLIRYALVDYIVEDTDLV